MQKINQQNFLDERSLFAIKEAEISYCSFDKGESPLKHSKGIKLYHTLFKWKYPLWYSDDIRLEDCTLFETARAGIWYTHKIYMKNCTIEAPKTFRRSSDITLKNITMPNAQETLWNCEDIELEDVSVKGDYFAMNSSNIKISNFNLVGNYSFDGARNVEIRNARMLSKDAFWNAQNITVYDSFISGEYLGWNSKNITLINCVIESLQGMCYIENIALKNCKTLNTTLAFEYSSVDADIKGELESVLNPSKGVIRAGKIGAITLDETCINPNETTIKEGEDDL